LHNICHTRARSTHEISVNKATLTLIYDLASESYLKLLVLTYDGSDSSETVSPGTVNDLHATVLNFSKSCRNHITILVYISFKDFEISPIFNVGYLVNISI